MTAKFIKINNSKGGLKKMCMEQPKFLGFHKFKSNFCRL